MRVLHVLEELRPSGAERMLEVAAPQWQQHGVVCEILSKGRSRGPAAVVLRRAGYPIHHVPFDPGWSYPARLAIFLRRTPFDVVHIHPEHANFWTAVVSQACGARGTVRTVHNSFRFKGGLRTQRRWQRRALRRMGVITVSIGRSVADNEARVFSNTTTVINNWFDQDRFVPPDHFQRAAARGRLGLPKSARIVCSVGNCAPVKQHLRILNALAQDGLTDVHYVHAGEEDADRTERRAAHAVGVLDRCIFLGPTTEILDALHASDAFVMPSQYEGLPIAALEALSTGMPCVFTNVPGLSDLATLNAPIVWAPDSGSIAASIRSALAREHKPGDPAAPEVHARVSQEFGTARGVAAYADLYRRLLD